ncbi:MAG: SDR family oxidoreductase [Pseudomonadales bacterium]|nr:SDR family oxidoreductase [Pseudomonadales bacterium]
MLLKDKVVIISGIGPGLGIELALRAAEQGANLVIAARTAEKLEAAKQQILDSNPKTEILIVPTDIADKKQCQQLATKAIEHFGRIDCLINSAYNPGQFEPIESADLDSWRSAMEVNLFGTMNITLEVIPFMKSAGGGSIVNINTMVTRKPMPTQAGYAASKAALTSATQHLAVELGPYNIRVNGAYMGWMWGPPVENYFKYQSSKTGEPLEELKAQVEKNIPLGRIPTDADCAKAVIFLASDYANAVSGACLDVNGGEFLPH